MRLASSEEIKADPAVAPGIASLRETDKALELVAGKLPMVSWLGLGNQASELEVRQGANNVTVRVHNH